MPLGSTAMTKISNRHRGLRTAAKVLLVLVSIPVLAGLGIVYANWSAHRQAQQFCDGIEVGSSISPAILEFERRVGKPGVLHGGDASGHLFMFKGFMFDKGNCSVGLSPDGKVSTKAVYMTSD